MSKFLKHFIGGVAVLAFAIAIAGCNTMEGAGKDVEAAGEAVQDAAD